MGPSQISEPVGLITSSRDEAKDYDRQRTGSLLPAKRILEAADRVLNLASYLVALPGSLQLSIARRLACGFFDSTLHFLGRAGHPILVHVCTPCCFSPFGKPGESESVPPRLCRRRRPACSLRVGTDIPPRCEPLNRGGMSV